MLSLALPKAQGAMGLLPMTPEAMVMAALE